MAFQSYVAGHFTESINLKSATTTVLVPARSGQKFVVRAVYYRMTARTGSGSAPSISIGVVGASFPIATNSIAATVTDQQVELAQNGTSKPTAQDVGSTAISVTVTAASTFTTHTADITVEGYYK